MIPTALWQKIGGFDERYAPAYCEDSDLCFAVRKAGFKVYYQPFSEVVHFEGITHGRDVKQGIKQYQVKNKKKFVEKWAPELAHQHAKGKTIFYDRDRSHQNKHILVIDHNVPTIDKDAGSRTINNFVDCLLDLGYRVKFMVPNMYPSASYMKLLQLKGVEVLHGEDYIAWKSGWKHYLIDNKAHFDAILLSRSSICIPILKFLRHIHYPGKVIYYGHDLGFRRIAEEAEVLGDNSLRKLAAKLKGDEDFMYQNSDTALMINYDEINYLKKYINKPVHYIPPYFFEETSDTPGFQERSGLLFVGGFGHPPNHEAVKWFMEDIYPALAEKQIPFTVAGANIPQFIIDYKATFPLFNTKSDLSVAELDAAYRAARLAVVPLKFGAGVKGKVIEAMAKGVPVVGTDKAFEGLMKDDQFPYKDCNKAEEMTRETELIYNNEQQWNTISNYGKNYIAHKFNRESMRQVFVDILN